MVFDRAAFAQHQRVVFHHDPGTGLRAIIAVHSTRLGPAAGGCRMWPYASAEEALDDVLRLSEAMTYKNALAGLPLGGGKSVIIGDPARDKTPALLAAFGRLVETLSGDYWTAEDVGIGAADVAVMRGASRHVFGVPGGTGDPSPFTARGVLEGMRACLRHAGLGGGFEGVTVAVQGVGNVGGALCHLLHAEGARLIVADTRPEAAAAAGRAFGATVTTVDAIHAAPADIFAPCALGGAISDRTLPEIRARIVCGAANNQLASPGMAGALAARGILLAPDFVVNAGGMLNAAWDILGGYSEAESLRRIVGIGDTVARVLSRAADTGEDTMSAAVGMARDIVRAGGPAQAGHD